MSNLISTTNYSVITLGFPLHLTSSQVIERIKCLILHRLDQSTLFYMGNAEKYVDSETYNLSVEAKLDTRLTYCLWGNVVKNPRYCVLAAWEKNIKVGYCILAGAILKSPDQAP